MRKRGAAIVTAVAAALVLVLGSSSWGATARFKAQGCASPSWNPSARTISKGDRIVWKNPTTCNHTVTAYGGGWSKSTTLMSGERTSRKFKKTGTFRFRCTVPGHSVIEGSECTGMCGRVVVTQ